QPPSAAKAAVFVHDAIFKTIKGVRRWDPRACTLLQHLANVVLSDIWWYRARRVSEFFGFPPPRLRAPASLLREGAPRPSVTRLSATIDDSPGPGSARGGVSWRHERLIRLRNAALAELMESESPSARPIADVCADLAALGIDPAEAIGVTRRIVAEMDSPAATLLDRAEESERIDADSRDVLTADITAVHEQIDEARTKSAIEDARRMARNAAKVVPQRPRTLPILCLVGAIAACLALFIAGREF